jgi:hypothetical protein
MSEGSSEEPDGSGIGDDELPEDLKPDEDNPLAEGLDAGETAGGLDPGELLDDGKPIDQEDDEESAED